MSKHTPGPWEFKIDGCWLINANGESIMGSETYYPWVPNNKADWHLIAAAPELLEALEDVMSYLRAIDETVDITYQYKAAKAAINKATGE